MRGRLAAVAGAVAAAVIPAVAAAAEPSVEGHYSKAYTACMNDAGGSTLPMRDCQDAEYADWDKALNQIYQVLIAARAPADKVALRDDERAWLKRTKTRCEHAGDDEAGGSLQGIEVQGCYLDETIRRTIYLRGLR